MTHGRDVIPGNVVSDMEAGFRTPWWGQYEKHWGTLKSYTEYAHLHLCGKDICLSIVKPKLWKHCCFLYSSKMSQPAGIKNVSSTTQSRFPWPSILNAVPRVFLFHPHPYVIQRLLFFIIVITLWRCQLLINNLRVEIGSIHFALFLGW